MKTAVEFSPSYSLLAVKLEPGETVRAEPGAMVAHQDVRIRTGLGGAVFGAARLMLGGESFLMNSFSGAPPPGRLGDAGAADSRGHRLLGGPARF